MGNSPSKILSRLRSKDHITEEEYVKLKAAVVTATESKEPTQFIHISGGYDRNVYCQKCGYKTTTYALIEAEYCPKCGRYIEK